MAEPGANGACCLCGQVRKLNDAGECTTCEVDDDSDLVMFDPNRIEHDH